MIKPNLTRLSLLTTFFLSISASNANEISTAETLEKQASHFLTEHFSKIFPNAKPVVSIQPLSARLNLEKCQQAIQFKTNNRRGGRVSLRVACETPRWQLYLSAEARIIQNVVAASTTLLKGPPILYNHLTLVETDTAKLYGNYFTAIDQVVGMTARHTIQSGEILKSSSLTAATLVSRDDAVTIEASSSNLSIRTLGTALQAGKKGDQIEVRNDKSGTVIKAIVIAPGLVRTP